MIARTDCINCTMNDCTNRLIAQATLKMNAITGSLLKDTGVITLTNILHKDNGMITQKTGRLHKLDCTVLNMTPLRGRLFCHVVCCTKSGYNNFVLAPALYIMSYNKWRG